MCPYQIFEFPSGKPLSDSYDEYSEATKMARYLATSNKLQIEVCEQIHGLNGSVQMILDGKVVFPDGGECEMPRFRVRHVNTPHTIMIRAKDHRDAVNQLNLEGRNNSNRKSTIRRYRSPDENQYDVFDVMDIGSRKQLRLTLLNR